MMTYGVFSAAVGILSYFFTFIKIAFQNDLLQSKHHLFVKKTHKNSL